MASADATPSMMERLLAAGARAYLPKPFDLRALNDELDRLMAESTRLLDAGGSSAAGA